MLPLLVAHYSLMFVNNFSWNGGVPSDRSMRTRYTTLHTFARYSTIQSCYQRSHVGLCTNRDGLFCRHITSKQVMISFYIMVITICRCPHPIALVVVLPHAQVIYNVPTSMSMFYVKSFMCIYWPHSSSRRTAVFAERDKVKVNGKRCVISFT